MLKENKIKLHIPYLSHLILPKINSNFDKTFQRTFSVVCFNSTNDKEARVSSKKKSQHCHLLELSFYYHPSFKPPPPTFGRGRQFTAAIAIHPSFVKGRSEWVFFHFFFISHIFFLCWYLILVYVTPYARVLFFRHVFVVGRVRFIRVSRRCVGGKSEGVVCAK